jgi:hypothetical protein
MLVSSIIQMSLKLFFKNHYLCIFKCNSGFLGERGGVIRLPFPRDIDADHKVFLLMIIFNSIMLVSSIIQMSLGKGRRITPPRSPKKT